MSATNYISILSGVDGVELAKFSTEGTSAHYLTAFESADVSFWTANANITSNTISLLPNAVAVDKIKIGTGPSAYHLLYKNNDTEISNITLSGNLSLTADGLLDVVGGPSAGSISVTTTSGSTFTNITQVRIDDSTGLLASNPVVGIAEVTYSNNIIYANQFVAFVSGSFPTTFTDTLDVKSDPELKVTPLIFDIRGPNVPPVPPIPNCFLPNSGSRIKISGAGVGQYLPPPMTPISPANPLGAYQYPPVTLPEPVAAPYYQTPPQTSLEFYGDGGGNTPYPSGAGFVPIQWFAKTPIAISNPVEAQRNFHFSETNIDVNLGIISADPYSSNVLEMRNYTGANVFSESYIGIHNYNPPFDTTKNRWEWKVHDDFNIDMLPYSYRSNVNEVNKITHSIHKPSGVTELSFATNYTPIVDGDAMFKFEPTPATVSEPSLLPTGTMTYYQEGSQIWQTDATNFSVQLTTEATTTSVAALISKGGLAVGKKSRFGDSIFIDSNVATTQALTITPHDRNLGYTDFKYSSSNVFSIEVPDLTTTPGVRYARQRLSLSDSTVQIGNYDSICNDILIKNVNGTGIALEDSNVTINPNTTDEIGFKVYSNTIGTTEPLLHIDGSNVSTGDSYFTINHKVSGSVKPLLEISESGASSGRTDFRINKTGTSNLWFDVHTSGTIPTLRLAGGSTYIGLNASSTTFPDMKLIQYTHNTHDTSAKYYNIRSKNYLMHFGRSRNISENSVINIDGRAIEYFQSDGVPQPESMNVFSTTSNTMVAMSFNADGTEATSNNFVEINPGNANNMGFKVNTADVSDALTIGSLKAPNLADYKVPIKVVSDTTTNLLAASYANEGGLVFDTTESAFAYYDFSNVSQLNYLQGTGSTFSFELYDSYSNLLTNFSNTLTANIAFANVITSNLTSNTTTQPLPEVAPPSNIVSPTWSIGDGNLRSMMQVLNLEARGTIKMDSGNYTSTVDYLAYTWGSSYPRNISFQLPYAQGGTPSTTPDNNSTQGRFYAPQNGWITSVSIKFYASIELKQGGGGGYINFMKGFAGFYLADGQGSSPYYGPARPADYRNPGNVSRYLKTYQVSSLTPGTTITIPASIIETLPSEDWVYVAKGDPVPYVSMTCPLTSGAGASPNGGGQFKIMSNNADDAAVYVTASVLFVMEPPILGTTRGDQRWEVPP